MHPTCINVYCLVILVLYKAVAMLIHGRGGGYFVWVLPTFISA